MDLITRDFALPGKLEPTARPLYKALHLYLVDGVPN